MDMNLFILDLLFMAIKTYMVRQGQTVFDLALQLYGDVSRVLDLCLLNPTTIPNVLTRNISGLTINYEEQNNDVTTEYAKNGTIITTQYPEFITGAAAFSLVFSSPFVPATTT